MARMSGALAGVLLLILVSLPASAQNSPATQVNCDSGQSIQTTVDTAPAGGRIDVSGPCAEAVTIVIDRVSIIAQGGAMISPPVGSEPAFMVVARGVEIRGFRINATNSANYGIFVRRGGSAELIGNNLQGVGVRVESGSTAVLERNQIRNSASIGVNIDGSSYAELTDNIISNCGATGVFVRASSSALLSGNDIRGCRSSGVGVVEGSQATIAGNTLRDNGWAGINLQLNATISLPSFAGGANTIAGNQVGVNCERSGAVNVAVAQMFGGSNGNASGNVSVKAGCDIYNRNSVPAFP